MGLAGFLEGLKLALMPLGETLGNRLPVKIPLWGVLTVAFLLGVAVTIAEPAIGRIPEILRMIFTNKRCLANTGNLGRQEKSCVSFLHLESMELIACIGCGSRCRNCSYSW
jgi:hypothetical protein